MSEPKHLKIEIMLHNFSFIQFPKKSLKFSKYVLDKKNNIKFDSAISET